MTVGKRISVVGCGGSGKTTVAERLANGLALMHVELDAIHWQPDWIARVDVEALRSVPRPHMTWRPSIRPCGTWSSSGFEAGAGSVTS